MPVWHFLIYVLAYACENVYHLYNMIAKTRTIVKKHDSTGAVQSTNFLDPEYIFLATANARCPNFEIYIKEGDHVDLYQVIGIRHGAFFDQPIHATVSGEYVGLEKHYHRNGKLTDFMKIKNDKKYTVHNSVKERNDDEIKKLSREQAMEILKDNAMVGLGGSSFPTYVKFQTKDKIDLILINGVECEPFINADNNVMWEEKDKLTKGMEYLCDIFECSRCVLCVKKMKKTLIKHYEEVFASHPRLEIKGIGNFYPQGWEVAMIKSATGIELKPGELPTKRGIIDFNVTSVVGIYTALKENKPIIIRDITVSGDGIRNPQNFKVRVGTPVKEIIEKCGGYLNEELPKVFILGGPMMGASLPNDDCIATKTVTSIIVLNEKNYKEEPCVRCGSCVLSCPTGLEPVQIMNAVKSLDKERIKYLNPSRCIECGLCTYSCTSKIKVLDYVRRAKLISKL